MAEKSLLPYHVDYVPDWIVEKAKDELNERDETREAIFKQLKQLVEKETKLNIYWKSDHMLMMVLRARKFKAKRALECLKTFYKTKMERSDVFPEKPDLDSIRKIYDCNYASSLPYRDEDGCAIIVINLGNWDPEFFPVEIALSAVVALVLASLEEHATQVCGVQAIIDMKTTSLNHVKSIKPKDYKLIGNGLKSALPVRVKAVHVVNVSTVTQVIFNLLKVCLSKKLRKRFHLHTDNMEKLYQYIPKEILPPQYGGGNIDYSASEWCKKEMESYYKKYSDLHINI